VSKYTRGSLQSTAGVAAKHELLLYISGKPEYCSVAVLEIFGCGSRRFDTTVEYVLLDQPGLELHNQRSTQTTQMDSPTPQVGPSEQHQAIPTRLQSSAPQHLGSLQTHTGLQQESLPYTQTSSLPSSDDESSTDNPGISADQFRRELRLSKYTQPSVIARLSKAGRNHDPQITSPVAMASSIHTHLSQHVQQTHSHPVAHISMSMGNTTAAPSPQPVVQHHSRRSLQT